MSIVFPIIGVPRSGTSLIASILDVLGVFIGDRFSHADPGWEPTPISFEDAEFIALHESLMGASDQVYMPGAPIPYPDCLPDWESLIALRKARHALWGAKDYVLPLLWRKFVVACDCETRLIVPTRKPESVLASYMARTGLSESDAMRFLQPRIDAVSDALTYSGQLLTVDFDSLISDPTNQVQRIADFIGQPSSTAAVDLVDHAWRRF